MKVSQLYAWGFGVLFGLATMGLYSMAKDNKIAQLEEQNRAFSESLTLDYKTLAKNYRMMFDSLVIAKGSLRSCHAAMAQ